MLHIDKEKNCLQTRINLAALDLKHVTRRKILNNQTYIEKTRDFSREYLFYTYTKITKIPSGVVRGDYSWT